MNDLSLLHAARSPKKHTHAWGPSTGEGRMWALGIAREWPEVTTVCLYCDLTKEDYEARQRRGRLNRARGNRLQAKAAKSAGIQNIGPLGLPEDAGNSLEWMTIQHKSGTGYPKLLDRWLRELTATADQLRAVVYTETPGQGRKAKRLIVMDYEEFLVWFRAKP